MPDTIPKANFDATLQRAIDEIGGVDAFAKAIGRRYQVVYWWREKGHLPRSEWTGETRYAELIEEAAQTVTAKELLSYRPVNSRGAAA